MEQEINWDRLSIKIWGTNVEPDCIQQARNLANHPSAYSHICLMPDTHSGYGMPIGGVCILKDAVSPNTYY